tara:strand:+ start:2958 stop:3434 length:477 start_codon:yes stop_codon:yes gene_type:complete
MNQLKLAINNNDTVKVINIVSIIGQNIFCFLSFWILCIPNVQTVVAQSISGVLVGIVTLEGLISFIYYNKYAVIHLMGVVTFIFSLISTILLLCNTEDNNKGNPVNLIERSLCLLIIGWGFICARITSSLTMYFSNLLESSHVHRTLLDVEYQNNINL